jgi:protocatechuate 3,4-dioxygenase beta subunit
MSSAAISCVVTCLVLWSASPVRADLLDQQQAPVSPSPPRSADPRDGEIKDAKGTAVLKGRIVAGDSGKPLRRARVTIRATELGSEGQRTTSTSLDGRYEFKDLPAARYRVSVARSGYLSLDHGQRRPGEIGRPVQLADGQTLDKVDFAMPRMGIITGRVTDESGDPIEGVGVFAARLMFFEGQRRLVPISAGRIQTDDEGEYRISRLAPGTYYVMATTKEMWTVTENGQTRQLGYMPTYFPGVANSPEARRLTIGAGERLDAIDFSLVPGRSAKVSGIAVDSAQRPFARVSMSEEVRGLGFASFGAGPSAAVAGDGTFTIVNVPPGEYTISASRMPGDAAGPAEVAIATLFVDGNDIENLSLVGSSGGTVRGRIIVEGDTPPKMSAVNVAVRQPLRNQPSPVVLGLQRNRATGVKEDGTFSAENVFGKTRFQVTLPEAWMLKSIVHDGKDITDTLVELGSGQELNDVQVVITSRVTTFEGRLADDKNQPVRDATVLVFDADQEKWFESTRRVRATRPDQDGQWRLRGMPAGEYLAIALDYVEDGAWNDPEYLEALRRDASAVTLAEGATAAVALKVVAPKR